MLTLYYNQPYVIKYYDEEQPPTELLGKISWYLKKLKRYAKESLVELKREHPTLLRLISNIISLSASIDLMVAAIRANPYGKMRDYIPGKLNVIFSSVDRTYDYLKHTESNSSAIRAIKTVLWFLGPIIKATLKQWGAQVIHPGQHGKVKRKNINEAEKTPTRDSLVRYNDGFIKNKIKLLKAKAQEAIQRFQKLTGKQKAIAVLRKLIVLCAAALAAKSVYDLSKFLPDIKFAIRGCLSMFEDIRNNDIRQRTGRPSSPQAGRPYITPPFTTQSMANGFDPRANEEDRRMREEQERRREARLNELRQQIGNQNGQAEQTRRQEQEATRSANQVAAVANDLLADIRSGLETAPQRQPINQATPQQRISGRMVNVRPRAGYELRKTKPTTYSNQASAALADLLEEEGYTYRNKYNFNVHKPNGPMGAEKLRAMLQRRSR